MARLTDELLEGEGQHTFSLAGSMGNQARKLLSPASMIVWTVETSSHFEAMTAYYKYLGWVAYTTDQAWDFQLYPDKWAELQLASEQGNL